MVLLLQDFVSSSLLSCSAISSHVTAGPTRNVTGDVMPLAEAITQLSFLEFLQRCGRLDCSSPAVSATSAHLTPGCCCADDSHLVAPLRMCPHRRLISQVSSLSFDVAVPDVFPRYSHLVSGCCRADDPTHYSVSARFYTDGFSLSYPRCSVDVFVQTPIRSTVPQDVAIQLPITEFFISCIFSSDPLDRQNFVRESPPSVQGPRVIAAASARTRTARPAFWSRHWFSLVHNKRRIYYSCTSTSSATFSYFSFVSTAPCLYHR